MVCFLGRLSGVNQIMGRPSHCCKCSPPEVECEIVGGSFVWSVKNAKIATLYTTTGTRYLVLDENGDAYGSEPIAVYPDQTGYSFRIDASNPCGAVTCKKDCLDFYCCLITADFQGCEDCDLSGIATGLYEGVQCRKDSIDIYWRVTRYTNDWTNISIQLNGQAMSGTPRDAGDGTFIVDGTFTVARCDLQEKYEIAVNGTSACGLDLKVGNWMNGPCCYPTYVSCIDRKNTLVTEVNISDYDYQWQIYSKNFTTFEFGYRNAVYTFKTTGLSALSGTYYYPLFCARRPWPAGTKQIIALGPAEVSIGRFEMEQTSHWYDRSPPPDVFFAGLATDYQKSKTVFSGDMVIYGCGAVGIKNRYMTFDSEYKNGNNPTSYFHNEGFCGEMGSAGIKIDCYPYGAYPWPPVSTCPNPNSFVGCNTYLFEGMNLCANPPCGQEVTYYINYSKPASFCSHDGVNYTCSNDSAVVTVGTVRGYYDCV